MSDYGVATRVQLQSLFTKQNFGLVELERILAYAGVGLDRLTITWKFHAHNVYDRKITHTYMVADH